MKYQTRSFFIAFILVFILYVGVDIALKEHTYYMTATIFGHHFQEIGVGNIVSRFFDAFAVAGVLNIVHNIMRLYDFLDKVYFQAKKKEGGQ